MSKDLNTDIVVTDRLYAIVVRKRPVTATCRLAKIRQQNVQSIYLKRLLREYQAVHDDKKETWLHEQETT